MRIKKVIFFFTFFIFFCCKSDKKELPKEFSILLEKILKTEYPLVGIVINETSPIINDLTDSLTLPPLAPSISSFSFEDIKPAIETIDKLKKLLRNNSEINKFSNTYHFNLNNPKIRLVSKEEIKKRKNLILIHFMII